MKQALLDAVDGTWAPAAVTSHAAWVFREGRGGGSRVSATTSERIGDVPDIDVAEAQMTAMGQARIFMIRDGDDGLDAALAARAYVIKDPVNFYACPVEQLCDRPLPPVTMLPVWEPLAMMREIWSQGGIGPDRLNVMHRVAGPKTGFLGRHNDKPAGAAFAAIHGHVAMVHAVEILPHQRRAGMGQWVMRAAALWARSQGAQTLAVLCTKANVGANGLYSSLAMPVVGQYHYRIQENL